MALVIEDGSIIADADSYATVEELEAYIQTRGVVLETALSNTQKEALLIQAMDFINAKYSSIFMGERVSANQELDWPRTGAWLHGFPLESDEIPRNIIYGQLAAAVEAITQDLLPNPEAAVKREKVGDIEVEYTNSGKVLPVSAFAKADALLRPLCKHGALQVVRT